MQEAMIPNYEVVAKEEDRAPIKKQVTWKAVVKEEAPELALLTLIQKLYSEALTEQKNKYQEEPDRVYVYIYPSKESSEAGTGAWVIMLEKGPEDAEPKVQINGERLRQLGQPAVSRFGLSEEERKRVFQEIVRAEDGAYSDHGQDENKEEKEKSRIAKKWGLTPEQLGEIATEGLAKGWRLP